jgi:large subunit ribosomal protein L18
MINKVNRSAIRRKKSATIRRKINGTAERPRLSVFKSSNLSVQIINDDLGRTLVSSSTNSKEFKDAGLKANISSAKVIGKNIAEKAIKQGITKVVFDRNGYIYTGVISALADSAREAGLEF